MHNDNELFSPEEMQNPFDAIKEVDAEGRKWWNSCRSACIMGYMKYWNFKRLMDKVATFLHQEKGLDLKEQMVEIEEMAQLNNGGWRQVKSTKNPFGADYFEELLDCIREIRLSERRYYQKITDIYAECSSDYDSNSDVTRSFYKHVQNMMHYAVTHQTTAEIISDRVDTKRPHMGPMTWKNAPDSRIIKSDITITKNYLSEQEQFLTKRLKPKLWLNKKGFGGFKIRPFARILTN